MKLVNRSVLVLKPTAKMLDWINSVGEESDTVTPEEAQEMTNAYLLPDFEDDKEQASFIRSFTKIINSKAEGHGKSVLRITDCYWFN